MQISREQGDELLALFCQLQTTLTLHYQGQLAEAQREADALVAQASGYGSHQYQAWGHTLTALLHLRKGQLGAARGELGSARKSLDRIDDPLCLLLFSSVQARIGAAQGEPRDARRSAERALALLEEHQPTTHEAVEAAAELATACAWLAGATPTHEHEPAVPHAPAPSPTALLDRALAHLVRLAGLFELALPRALLLQSAQAELAGRSRRARALSRLALRHARRLGVLCDQARAQQALGRLAPADSAARRRHEREADELLRRLGLSGSALL